MFRFFNTLRNLCSKRRQGASGPGCDGIPFGLIAGNGPFPFEFVRGAEKQGYSVFAVAHLGQTDPSLQDIVADIEWVKVGELGRTIEAFKRWGVKQVAMAGGINRVSIFGGVKLDRRALALITRLRSAKDDVIMRGIAEEIESEGMEVVSCVKFMLDSLAPIGSISKRQLTEDELVDIAEGVSAIKVMSSQHIGQTVCVREGVIVAVEAVEGTDATILRGGKLGGRGTVVVKCAKTIQDMRFDVPTVGLKTVECMSRVGASVLALESGRCLIIDREATVAYANRHKIAIVGIEPLVC